MLFRATIGVFCETHVKHKFTMWINCRIF